MKALTLHREWAYAILSGKDIENRSWWPSGFAGSDLLIHVGQERSREAVAFCAARGVALPEDIRSGYVIAVVTVKGCHNSAACVRLGPLADLHPDGPFRCSQWALGGATGHGPMMHWELTNVRRLKPIQVPRGYQKLWNTSERVDAEVDRQLGRAVTR